MNFYAKKLSSNSFKELSQAAIKAKIYPLEFIKKLVNVYIKVSECESVKNAIINDDRCFSVEILTDLGHTCEKKSLLNSAELATF